MLKNSIFVSISSKRKNRLFTSKLLQSLCEVLQSLCEVLQSPSSFHHQKEVGKQCLRTSMKGDGLFGFGFFFGITLLLREEEMLCDEECADSNADI